MMIFPTLLLFFLCCGAHSLSATSRVVYGGTGIEEIREGALSLYNATDASIRERVIFPDLRFICPGTITTVWFIARSRDTNTRIEYPEFQLWYRGSITNETLFDTLWNRYKGRIKEKRSPAADGSSLSIKVNSSVAILYEYRLEEPMQFEAGDILGMKHPSRSPLLVQYLNGGRVRNFQWFFQKFLYGPSVGLDREPLISLGVSDSSCTRGLLSMDALELYMENVISRDFSNGNDLDSSPERATDIPADGLSYVFRSLQFRESGLLEKWVFAATVVRPPLTQPDFVSIDFQVWREGMIVNSTRFSNTTLLTRTGHPNVYEYVVHPPLSVLAGDYVGISIQQQSSLRPQWVVAQTGSEYQRVLDGEESNGRAIPLFAAQIQVTSQPVTSQPSPGPSETSSIPSLQPSTTSPAVTSLPSAAVIASSSLAESATAPPAESVTASPAESATAPPAESVTAPPSLSPTPNGSPTITSTNAGTQTTTRSIYEPTDIATTTTESTPSVDLFPTTTVAPTGQVPPVSNDPSSSTNSTGLVVAIVLVVLFSAVAVAVLVLIVIMRRRRRRKKGGKEERNADSEQQQQSRDGFFDNPVYEHLQRKLSRKDSNDYTTISDHTIYHVPDRSAFHAVASDRDSGYAEPVGKYVAPSRSPSATSAPSSPSHHGPFLAPVLTTHHYHTLEQSKLPADYIQPRPSSRTSANCDIAASSRSNTQKQESCDHEYHELDPNSGGRDCNREYLDGIYVPTQEERMLSKDKDSIYATVGERLYASVIEAKSQQSLSFFEECDVYWQPACCTAGLHTQLAQKKYREILRDQIKIQHPLGSGHFGEVSKGAWQSGRGPVEVAVKTLKRGSSEEDMVKFLQEAAIMGQFRHPNIVQLHGVVTLGEQTMIILEFLSRRDLGTFLVNKQPMPGSAVPQDTPFLLLGFCKDVASGMEYLHCKAFVHRDLAARNILVSSQNTCKIGDFGMSRDLLQENYYVSQGGMIPLKWTAPEALHYRKYSTASDMWSFGCLMYEIWSLGHKPFEKYQNQEVQRLLDRGERLPPPPGCPRGIYSLMMECWHPDESSRPTFIHLLKTLTRSPGQLLSWSHEDTWGVAEAIVLGALLQAGKKLYHDLQDEYSHSTN